MVFLEERDDVVMWDKSVGRGFVLRVRCGVALDGAYEGCSIAINGVCLTATALLDGELKFGLAPETYVEMVLCWPLAHEVADCDARSLVT